LQEALEDRDASAIHQYMLIYRKHQGQTLHNQRDSLHPSPIHGLAVETIFPNITNT
jgi:hypothetical protein